MVCRNGRGYLLSKTGKKCALSIILVKIRDGAGTYTVHICTTMPTGYQGSHFMFNILFGPSNLYSCKLILFSVSSVLYSVKV